MPTSDARLVERLVDTDRYPLPAPGSRRWAAVVARVRQDLAARGCSVLEGFVRPELHEALRREGAAVAPRAHYDVETVNVYNIAPDPSLPDDHPARVPMERGNAFVARDHIPADLLVHRLYTSRLLQRFVAACMGRPEVHPLADPLAGLCLNIVPPGRAHPWHFDTNEFVASILTQRPEGGGVFEYCPHIRSADDERFAEVRAVLDGRRHHLVHRLALRPGDLQLFAGRYSLHRVTTVTGATARHSAILSYCERPGVIGSVERTRQLFGRVGAEHLVAAGRAVRGDRLLD
jgi:hypothetical protein